jgi:hypothetical protein
MRQKLVIGAAAWLEIIVGALFLTVPDLVCLLLFGAKPEAVGMSLGRFAGIGLIGLGVACLPSSEAGSRRGAVQGLLAFNIGVAILFADLGVATALHGVLLWPAVVLHAVIAAALLPYVLRPGTSPST